MFSYNAVARQSPPLPPDEQELELVVQRRTWKTSHDYRLHIVQEPEEGRAAGKEKTRTTRWPIDPPPVIEFTLDDQHDRTRSYLHSPFWFCTAELDVLSKTPSSTANANLLHGCLVSSLHKVKLADNKEHGLFIFGDLNAKFVGRYRLRFTLWEMRQSATGLLCAAKLAQVHSKHFNVITPKEHQNTPHRESTAMSRMLCEAGVKLRIRKESSKRKPQSTDWAASKRQAIDPYSMGPPPPFGTMGPPSRYPISSENISHRLTYESQTLGIKDHMDSISRQEPYVTRGESASVYQTAQLGQIGRAALPTLPSLDAPGFRMNQPMAAQQMTPRPLLTYQSSSTLGMAQYSNRPDLRSSGSYLSQASSRSDDASTNYQLAFSQAPVVSPNYYSDDVPQPSSMPTRQSSVNNHSPWHAPGMSGIVGEDPVGYIPRSQESIANGHMYASGGGNETGSHPTMHQSSFNGWTGLESRHMLNQSTPQRSTDYFTLDPTTSPNYGAQNHYEKFVSRV